MCPCLKGVPIDFVEGYLPWFASIRFHRRCNVYRHWRRIALNAGKQRIQPFTEGASLIVSRGGGHLRISSAWSVQKIRVYMWPFPSITNMAKSELRVLSSI